MHLVANFPSREAALSRWGRPIPSTSPVLPPVPPKGQPVPLNSRLEPAPAATQSAPANATPKN